MQSFIHEQVICRTQSSGKGGMAGKGGGGGGGVGGC